MVVSVGAVRPHSPQSVLFRQHCKMAKDGLRLVLPAQVAAAVNPALVRLVLEAVVAVRALNHGAFNSQRARNLILALVSQALVVSSDQQQRAQAQQ